MNIDQNIGSNITHKNILRLHKFHRMLGKYVKKIQNNILIYIGVKHYLNIAIVNQDWKMRKYRYISHKTFSMKLCVKNYN